MRAQRGEPAGGKKKLRRARLSRSLMVWLDPWAPEREAGGGGRCQSREIRLANPRCGRELYSVSRPEATLRAVESGSGRLAARLQYPPPALGGGQAEEGAVGVAA